MKLFIVGLLVSLLQTAKAIDTLLASSFTLLDWTKFKISLETDYNVGYQAYHIGKPSDFHELADEYRTSINAKQWLRINYELRNQTTNSVIWEWTWFEFRPIDLHTYFIQPEDFGTLVKDFQANDIEAHISANWFIDAFSLKLFRIKYPSFCVIELASMIGDGNFLDCGYKG